jgi:hypothetical protein
MSLSFPLSPALNQTYTSGSNTWIWDGVAWTINPNRSPTFDTLSAATVLASSIPGFATTASLSSYATTASLSSYATTASLSSYVTNSSLSTTLTSYTTTASTALKANIASPAFGGTITAPTAIIGGVNIKAFAIAMGAALA